MSSSPSIGFAPIAQTNATILVLGSMPSVESLKQQQYYAHPRNAFWPIMADTFQFSVDLSYQERCTALINNKVAVWDVLQSCQRQGSLDSNIESSSIISNDFRLFFQQHPGLRLIIFNGAKAEQIFKQYVVDTLNEHQLSIRTVRLASTSPAHASMSLDEKIRAWKNILLN
jgi:TDG/mug DNA glycosylase family protein